MGSLFFWTQCILPAEPFLLLIGAV